MYRGVSVCTDTRLRREEGGARVACVAAGKHAHKRAGAGGMLRARRAPLRRVGAPLQRAGARRARQSRERSPRRASASALGAGGGGGEGEADEEVDKDKDKGTLSAADLASLRERIDLVETKERQIADIEGVFSSIEGMLGVRILDEKVRRRLHRSRCSRRRSEPLCLPRGLIRPKPPTACCC